MIKNINIVGLGYVGQTLALTLAESGFKVYCTETDNYVLEEIRKGKSHIKEPNLENLVQKHLNTNFFVGHPKDMYKNQIDAFIICVSSPLNKVTKEPNLEMVKNALLEITKYIKKGQLVILRSTVPVGTTRKIAKHILEQSGLECGKDFYLVFAPERTVEGNALEELRTLPQIIGGINKESIVAAIEIFKVAQKIIPVSSLEVAELIKLIDNSYRDVRFGFSNELAIYCGKIGVSASEVINIANQDYERNDIPNHSPGVGGTCLSKDPYILLHGAKEVGTELSIINSARKVNESLPELIFKKIKNHIQPNKKVLIVGFAFKGQPETNDIRESPTLNLVNLLKREDVEIMGYDPCVEDWKIKNLQISHIDNLQRGLEQGDIVIFMTNHKSFSGLNKEVFSKMKQGSLIFDGWGLFKGDEIESLGLKYIGVDIG